eukprot:9491807-Pyramimonas_sp.AAC.1
MASNALKYTPRPPRDGFKCQTELPKGAPNVPKCFKPLKGDPCFWRSLHSASNAQPRRQGSSKMAQ